MLAADYLVLLLPLSLVYLWFQDRRGKEDAGYTFYASVLGILLSYGMSMVYFHKNPSAVYDTIAAYHSENSFPSQHTAALFASALPLIYRERENLGGLLMAAGLLTGFSRIYIGEHWPVDIAGAFIAAAAGLFTACKTWNMLEPVWRPVVDISEKAEAEIKEKVKRRK